LSAQLGQVAFGMALAYVYRQVGTEPGEMAAATERRGTERPAGMLNDLLDCLIDLGAGAPHLEAGVVLRVEVDPGGAFAKGGTGTVQGCIDCAQMRIGMRVAPGFAALFVKVAGQGLGAPYQQAAIPAPPCQKPGRDRYWPGEPMASPGESSSSITTLLVAAMPTACQCSARMRWLG